MQDDTLERQRCEIGESGQSKKISKLHMYKRKSAQKAVDETPQGRVHMAEQFLAEQHTERVMIANREDEGCAIKKKERNTTESIVFTNKKVGRTPAN